ncbi:MAG: hypothetical protein RO257_08395 [Candidatus Kapabacteria bacterium]|nr:hypothetical protein [Candidatus Kapabacteria bacterium]
MNKVIISIILLVIFTSCINLREPYPQIEFYTLTQEPSLLHDLPKKQSKVMVRNIIVNESINTPHLLINWDASRVQKLFYHRWISDLSSLSTDFFITRLNQCGLLNYGVIRSGSIATPEYIIEPHLIDFAAYNTEMPNSGENYVEIELKVDVLKRMPNNNLDIVFSNIYKQKFIRKKTEIKYIPDSYSKIFSIAVDNVISDLSNLLN